MKINVWIKNNDMDLKHETNAILQDEVIKYNEKDKTKVVFNYKKNKLTRENNELKMVYLFEDKKKTEGIITIKEINKVIKIDIDTKKIKRKNNDIEIVFTIEKEKFIYRIEEVK